VWLGQSRMPRQKYRLAGFAHLFIFGAFLVLLLNTLLLWSRGFDPDFDAWGWLARGSLTGDVYTLIKEFFAATCVLGTGVFFYYRLVVRSPRMTLGVEGLIILGIIATMMMADFLYVGATLALEQQVWWAEPVSSLLARALRSTDADTLYVLQQVGFWWHASFPLLFLNLLPYSKHFHVITAAPNVFATRLEPRGKLPLVSDLEGKVEREEPVGYGVITDLSWKQMLDLYTCTECGRCSDNCPAYTTGKKLSPKHLTLALRDHLYASEGRLLGGKDDVQLVPQIIDPEVIWACTSCRACEEQCPVMISYVDKIVEMRRNLVTIRNEFPAELAKPFNGIETNGNPWNLSSADRANWAEDLDIPTLATRPDAPVLYWVGCAASFDARAKKVARAVAKLLKHAGVDFAILGTEETCTGDPARRAGNEYLFQMVAAANVETLNRYQVKTVITACPHCFNTLKNEYPDFGGQYDVVHHTDFLLGLLREGKLAPEKRVEGPVAYHDSCYLGRYNDIYDAPRALLQSIPGVELREVEYWNKSRGLCCGAGGAQMFMEEQPGNQRVNNKRTLQLLQTGASTLATGCPFCMTMISDGLKAENQDETIAQRDVAELLADSVL
jgi:Fe-S oxidoreductase